MSKQVEDTCVIYESRADKCWIAHSLRTDQIGAGDCVVAALEDLLRAVEQVFKLAAEDGDVAIFREAPKRIQKMAESAEPLPREIYEIAHKRVHGGWPADFEPRFKTPHRRKFIADIHEAVGA